MTSLVVRKNSEIAERPVLLVEYDAEAISSGVAVEVAAKWAYDLPGGGGQGVGVRGAEEGVRLLASRGEIIRVEECVLQYHDDREAFFQAKATRFVVQEDGTELRLDSQVRAKRVSKLENHSDSYMRDHPGAPRQYLNANWYEVGVAKASRNAALALMPSNIKSALLKAGLDAVDQLKRPAASRTQSRAPQREVRRPAEAETPAPASPTHEDPTPAPVVPSPASDLTKQERVHSRLIDAMQTWDAPSQKRLFANLKRDFPKAHDANGKLQTRELSDADCDRILLVLEPS